MAVDNYPELNLGSSKKKPTIFFNFRDSRRDKVGLQQVPQGDFNTSEINAVCEDESQSMQVDSQPKSESASEAGDADCVLPEPSHTVGKKNSSI